MHENEVFLTITCVAQTVLFNNHNRNYIALAFSFIFFIPFFIWCRVVVMPAVEDQRNLQRVKKFEKKVCFPNNEVFYNI